MSKVYCRLAGGLGNQIFQYGASLLISKKKHVPFIQLDDSGLSTYKAIRSNELPNYFKLENAMFKKNNILKLRLPKMKFLTPFANNFIGDLNFNRLIDKNLKSKNYYLDGYFQSCLNQSVFDEMLSALKQDYIYSSINVKKNVCAIHIRGGDFLTEKYSDIASVDYYHEKLTKVKELNIAERFIIVTDDRRYASELAKKISLDYSFSEGSMLEDFLLIAQSQIKILSNSTFSIWASALGFQPGCIVFAPQMLTVKDTRNFILPGELI
ncbi:hypothetical protein LFZ5_10870 [Salmonella enterica subsp. enterica serovar Apapa str. SA20060561]|uniref:alpha-1,2-fucosyltransferase n=1 Tax=Salmonella enterica TaxID=28901 RepID=UPI000973C133|nr:alpha-1,2-fucosyltransferase [Salmonella enterica]APY32478.1 hypothetical protein LFZ5_10870 [Salmonella enterica subsp. enterica serovar Apapa str. SA20060561]